MARRGPGGKVWPGCQSLPLTRQVPAHAFGRRGPNVTTPGRPVRVPSRRAGAGAPGMGPGQGQGSSKADLLPWTTSRGPRFTEGRVERASPALVFQSPDLRVPGRPLPFGKRDLPLLPSHGFLPRAIGDPRDDHGRGAAVYHCPSDVDGPVNEGLLDGDRQSIGPLALDPARPRLAIPDRKGRRASRDCVDHQDLAARRADDR